MGRVIVSGIVFLLVQLLNYGLLIHRVEPFMYQFYLIAWWSYVVCLDMALCRRGRPATVLNGRLAYLVIVSCAFWCLFELLNVRLQNWFYINLPRFTPLRFAGYLVAFGTVIPAILVTKEAVSRMLPPFACRRFSLKGYPIKAITASALMLVLVLLFPRHLFPFAWVFLAPVTDALNYARGFPSFMRDLEEGSPGRLIATLIAGLLCGILWEAWNYWAVAKWIYTVPFFENAKIFEMPVLGYLGFPLFAVETVSFLDLLQNSRAFATHQLRTAALALCLSAVTFMLIDRHTVFSFAAPVGDLTFISGTMRAHLEEAGIRTSHAVDGALLEPHQRAMLDLVHMKGLGLVAFRKLADQGISDTYGVSAMSVSRFGAVVGEMNPRRVRVFLKAARESAKKAAVTEP